MKTVCEVHDAIDHAILNDNLAEARALLVTARKMADRMECRLLRYRRAIEVLGFNRDDSTGKGENK